MRSFGPRQGSGLLLDENKIVTQIFLTVMVFLFRSSMIVSSGGILGMVTSRPGVKPLDIGLLGILTTCLIVSYEGRESSTINA